MKNLFCVFAAKLQFAFAKVGAAIHNLIPALKYKRALIKARFRFFSKYYLPYIKALKNKWVAIWGGACVCLIITAVFLLNLTANYYQLEFNGKNLGYSRSITTLNTALADVKAEFALNNDVQAELSNFKIIEVQSSNLFLNCFDKAKLKDIIVNAAPSISKGYGVYINGEFSCAAKSLNMLEATLNNFKIDRAVFCNEINSKTADYTVKIKQIVEFREQYFLANEVHTDDTYKFVYAIFEDCLDYTIDCTQTVTESVPYITYYERNGNLKPGAKKTVKKGANGSKSIKYHLIVENGTVIEKQVLSEQVTKHPSTAKIQIGSGVISGQDSHVALQFPVEGYVSSAFGDRADPFTGHPAVHNGLDIAAVSGTPIYAAAGGKVIQASDKHNGYGKCVIIEHSSGFKTLYGHCSKLLVKEGTYVLAGQKIAEVGSTGRSTGPHLHFTIFINDTAVDPAIYF